jgi:hypothetical protein
MIDLRPRDCRFRQQEEGRAYPRSSCGVCGKTITTGLGVRCTYVTTDDAAEIARMTAEIEALRAEVAEAREAMQAVADGNTPSCTKAVRIALTNSSCAPSARIDGPGKQEEQP